ncbi:MAG: chromate transporter [Kiritimatiellae bacterium]|mgnify:CR=1|jgi:chromate transporter|nr:chromate transporter [Kiritimatiellia bacterium]NLD90426.1 chromate transporter [Lentisphaerota bacterium]HPC19919.1 chromate transporter [Kiritimatiellia bacterium]HQN80974.1 chromate transporter [Kiritimatiellia bacterium]
MNTHLLLFWTFFKISLFSIGGGYNMIPLMQHEVAARGWLASERFLDILAVSEITPGPVAVNLATFTGYQLAGFTGALATTTGVCLPGSLILLALGAIAIRLRTRPAFQSAMRGVMPMLVGLLAATAIRMAAALVPEAFGFAALQTLVIFALTLGLFVWHRLPPATLMLSAAAAGILGSLLR